MADGTKIEWTDATWNPITGCSVTSPGCTNCYAMHLAGTRLAHHPSRAGLTYEVNGNHVWTGATRFNGQWFDQPLRWRKPRRIFVCAHGDLFHESVPYSWIDRVFAVMSLAPQHTFQVLTKRASRMREYIASQSTRILSHTISATAYFIAGRTRGDADELAGSATWPLPNVWLGVSVEDQRRANERIPELLATPAAVRWISAEPLLGPVYLTEAWHGASALDSECWGECNWCCRGPDYPPLWNCQSGRQSGAEVKKMRSSLDWVVVGGESGPGARPMHPDWARSLRDQCAGAGTPFFFKQWGEWLHGDQFGLQGDAFHRLGKSHAGRLLDGREHNAFPEVTHG